MGDERGRRLAAYLQRVREAELAVVTRRLRNEGFLRPGLALLEIGAGTGAQALELERLGFAVSAIDLPESEYAGARVRAVADYDGRHIPFPDSHFDVVFSSNVMEHIPHADEFQAEIRRVLKDDGLAIHVIPSASWRFWTNLTYYPHALSLLWNTRRARAVAERRRARSEGTARWKMILSALFPPRHGERGNWFTEQWYFRRHHWSRLFGEGAWEIASAEDSGIFYTGYCILALRLPMPARRALAPLLGASTNVFVLRKKIRRE